MAPKTTKPKTASGVLRVRATQEGYYPQLIHTDEGAIVLRADAYIRRREGDVFEIRADRWPEDDIVRTPTEALVRHQKGTLIDFSDLWMDRVDDETPLTVSTVKDAQAKHHDEILAARAGVTPGSPTSVL